MGSESTRMAPSCAQWTVSVLAFVLVVSPAAKASIPCANTAVTEWTTAAGGNGHSYQAVCGALTWSQANSAATAAGGHLATIQSSAENDFVFGLVDDAGFWLPVEGGFNLGPWLGGFQPPGSAEPNDSWGWVTGETFGFTHWMSNEPNNF